jgi:hypothetical protein
MDESRRYWLIWLSLRTLLAVALIAYSTYHLIRFWPTWDSLGFIAVCWALVGYSLVRDIQAIRANL